MIESRIEKFTRISQEMAAAVAEMRADAADVTNQDPETAALVEELSVTCDRWSQWEEVAAVALTHLQSTGRLVPAGGMALTAEEKAEIWQQGYDFGVHDERMSQEVTGGEVAPARGNPFAASALFPATEPAEARCTSSFDDHRCELRVDHDGDFHKADNSHIAWEVDPAPAEPSEDSVVQKAREEYKRSRLSDLPPDMQESLCPKLPPGTREYDAYAKGLSAELDEWSGRAVAPAEPSEEETKAEDYCCHPKCRWTDWGGRNRKHIRGEDCPIVPMPGSSPVVPAPTETGPWETWQEVPEGVKYTSRADRHPHAPVWINQGGNRLTRKHSGEWMPSILSNDDYSSFAPFVAAEEG